MGRKALLRNFSYRTSSTTRIFDSTLDFDIWIILSISKGPFLSPLNFNVYNGQYMSTKSALANARDGLSWMQYVWVFFPAAGVSAQVDVSHPVLREGEKKPEETLMKITENRGCFSLECFTNDPEILYLVYRNFNLTAEHEKKKPQMLCESRSGVRRQDLF